MLQPMFLEEIDDNGIAWLTLTRPEVHNAFNDTLIGELTSVLTGLGTDERVRAVVLSSKGRSFSAGADLKWMQRTAKYTKAENQKDARALAGLMRTLNGLAKPTLVLVQGPAIGGGVGLVACCDIAIAAETAKFGLTEVKLGIIPAVISPYVIDAIGQRAARRYFLTGELFGADEALRLGLVHMVVPDEALHDVGKRTVTALLAGGPNAQKAAKALILEVADLPLDDSLVELTAQRIAALRVSEEAQEGIAAFLDKRKPRWVKS